MDSTVVKLMIEGGAQREAQHQRLVLRLVGFTPTPNRIPRDRDPRSQPYIGDMEPILLTYRGHIDRYMATPSCASSGTLDFETYRILAVWRRSRCRRRWPK